MTTTLRRAMVAIATLAAAIVGVTASPAAAADFTVRQGETVEIDPGGVSPGPGQLEVTPAEAGTAVLRPGGGIRFTASTAYLGAATIAYASAGLSWRIEVVGEQATVGATFTPRAAPGPCIVIVSGGSVAFGDVVVGTPVIAPTTTRIEPCSTAPVSLLGSVAPAVAGPVGARVTLTPTVTAPPPAGQFRYVIGGTPLNAVPIEDTSNWLLGGLGTGLTITHTLEVGAGTSTSLLGQSFSTTVAFTAIPV